MQRVFRDELGHAGAVEPHLDLQRDLRVDSLNAVILAVALEDHFRVRLGQEDTVGVVTVGELVARVAERVRTEYPEGRP
jgi:acyl carrier protein